MLFCFLIFEQIHGIFQRIFWLFGRIEKMRNKFSKCESKIHAQKWIIEQTCLSVDMSVPDSSWALNNKIWAQFTHSWYSGAHDQFFGPPNQNELTSRPFFTPNTSCKTGWYIFECLHDIAMEIFCSHRQKLFLGEALMKKKVNKNRQCPT